MYLKLARIMVLLCSVLVVGQTSAHFLLNLNVRILHIEHSATGLEVHMRLPMPYLVADKLGPKNQNGKPVAAPYTQNAMEEGVLVHYLDQQQFATDPNGLGEIAALGHQLRIDEQLLEPKVVAVRVYKRGQEPSFATLASARSSLRANDFQPDGSPPYVGDVVVDILATYSWPRSASSYSISSTLNPGLPGQEDTANLIIDYGAGQPKIFRSRGLLDERIEISNSMLAAIATFVEQGILHILGGLDHVLFVLCLVIGAQRLRGLVERITGFTVGHTITLIAGFLGFVPSGAWFVPLVELGIAISIVYAALLAIRSPGSDDRDRFRMFVVTTLIGLLHGFGFSFVLQEILQIDSPNLWQSLIAFNVGVEIGQLAIVLLVWPSLQLVRKISQTAWRNSCLAVAIVCCAIAFYWIFERSLLLINV